MERIKHIAQLNFVLGVWLIVAPFVLGYTGAHVQTTTDIVVGGWLIGCSAWMLASGGRLVTAATFALVAGLWLIGAPFLLHTHASRPLDNDVAVGALSVVVSGIAMSLLLSKPRTA